MTIDEIVQWQHLNQHINIYLHREYHKTSVICSVHGDQQRNNIYLQRCVSKELSTTSIGK